jgi:hypothetical protein
MKKLSNKKRKLKFIREKNKLRLGKSKACSSSKISKDFTNSVELLENDMINHVKYNFEKKYKLKFKYTWYKVGLSDDDYIKNLITIAVYCSNNINHLPNKNVTI